MNSKSITFKLRLFTLSIILLVSFVIIYSLNIIYNKNTSYPTVNKGRVLISSVKSSLEEAIFKNDLSDINSKYPFAIIDLQGKVLYSSINIYKKDNIINLNDFIEYDNSSATVNPELIKYSTALSINNVQIGTAIFLIPKKDILPLNPSISTLIALMPIVIALLLIILITIYIYILIKKDILSHLTEIHNSARKILKGDFSNKIIYDYDNEIGAFCHDFEAMRDEFKFSKEKELTIKTKEKELLACLSHDIKTPLTAIHGYVSGIKDGIVNDKEGIDNYCDIILNRVKMLNKLLEDILEHSKAELNKMEITLNEFYCKAFFIDILEDLCAEIQSKGLKFIYPDRIPNVIINGDKKRLSQVMYNLVSNSIKYSKEKGTVSIYFETDNNYLYVYVKDNGFGISSADIPNIFNKFYRGEKSRNQNIPGSGLGLSISKYIIEAHGGFINCVESSSDNTIFCFTLPI